jgi:hypothetical protein
MTILCKALGFVLVLSAMAGVARAVDVPEIDPGSAGSALTLLVGGLLIVKDRLRRK